MTGESAGPGPSPAEEPLGAMGEEAARLMPLVYDELRRTAASMMRSDAPMTLQPTALVHEAFLKVASQRRGQWNNEAHFRAVASIAMRQILSDHVRGRKSQKRGEGVRAITVELDALGADVRSSAVELDAALEELEVLHPRVASVVVFRFFGGLSVREVAERLSVSLSSAESDWRFARAWLKRRLRGSVS